jgi:D-alanyl-D-alanine carboxypeptidase/D-alanyl-D-alanine-endopeptidase (penicillin-binding protein 4)
LNEPDRERILRLQQSLHAILDASPLRRARVGMRVMDARTGRVFFEQNENVLMDPASNQKILASITAFMRLGPQFRFETLIEGPEPNVAGEIPGSVYLSGSGDPSLRMMHIEALADSIFERGVRKIRGDVLSVTAPLGHVVPAKDAKSALQVTGARLSVRVRPAARGRGRPSISVWPASDMVHVRNRAVTRRRGRSRIRVSVELEGRRIVVTVTGRIHARHPGWIARRRPRLSTLYAAVLLRAALEARGIEVTGDASTVGRVPDGINARLAVHRSEPLWRLARTINKYSNNDYADRLLEAVGGIVYQAPPSMGLGVRALRETMAELGLPDDAYVPHNGSGLGHQNRISAKAISQVLWMLMHDVRFGPDIMQSLSVGGIDGTTRNRFRGQPVEGYVRSKTGTLNGKSALSGVVGDGDQVLIYSILVDKFRRRRLTQIRNGQVEVVLALWDFIRGVVGETPEDVIEPGVDFETGEPPEEDAESNVPLDGVGADAPMDG